MPRLSWDEVGQRLYETGVDRGVLYLFNPLTGLYDSGFAWNGLVSVSESPSGAEVSPQYADNIKYLELVSAEELGGTIEAFTYPDEFAECDGSVEPEPGVFLGQQARRRFGLVYRTKLGNDSVGDDYGYKLHLIYGARANPAERAYTTVNDSPEALTFSWEITTSPVSVTGHKPVSQLTVVSTDVLPADLTELENILYGTESTDGGVTPGTDPRLPLPDEVLSLMAQP